jgi:hypothetical protein
MLTMYPRRRERFMSYQVEERYHDHLLVSRLGPRAQVDFVASFLRGQLR